MGDRTSARYRTRTAGWSSERAGCACASSGKWRRTVAECTHAHSAGITAARKKRNQSWKVTADSAELVSAKRRRSIPWWSQPNSAYAAGRKKHTGRPARARNGPVCSVAQCASSYPGQTNPLITLRRFNQTRMIFPRTGATNNRWSGRPWQRRRFFFRTRARPAPSLARGKEYGLVRPAPGTPAPGISPKPEEPRAGYEEQEEK